MNFKKIFVAAALLSIVSCESTPNNNGSQPSYVQKLDLSISCFESDGACVNQIGVKNKSKNTAAINLNVFCPDKVNPATEYKLESIMTLEPGASKCFTKDDIRAHCGFSYGFFIGDNVAIKVTADGMPKWEKKKTCTWE